jgi:hypothetical protein
MKRFAVKYSVIATGTIASAFAGSGPAPLGALLTQTRGLCAPLHGTGMN